MVTTGSVVVSWDFSNGKDIGILIVGKQENGRIEIVNAFRGAEAEELYKKLAFPKPQKTSFEEGGENGE